MPVSYTHLMLSSLQIENVAVIQKAEVHFEPGLNVLTGETGEQAKVLNQMIAQWIDVSEKNAPFLQNMHLKEMVGHTPLQVCLLYTSRCV